MIDLRHRIDGAAEWAKLLPDVQSAIGACALDLVAAWVGFDAAVDNEPGATPANRAFEAADILCSDRLLAAVIRSVLSLDPDQPPLTASLGRVCHRHGRGERDPCDPQDRVWQAPDLCSTCGASGIVDRGLTVSRCRPAEAARAAGSGAGQGGRGLPLPPPMRRPRC